MFGIAMLCLLGVGLVITALDHHESPSDMASEEESDDLASQDTIVPVHDLQNNYHPEVLDTGASADQIGKTVTIEVGEDEPGYLAAVQVFTESTPGDASSAYQESGEIRFYLLQNEANFVPSDKDLLAEFVKDYPEVGLDDKESPFYLHSSGSVVVDPQYFLNNLNGELLLTVDMGYYSSISDTESGVEKIEDFREDSLDIESDQPITYFDLRFQEGGSERQFGLSDNQVPFG